MKQDNDEKDRSLGLSPAQVAGSALAAMSGAFFVSWAGTAGTLIGAAVGSVIATVGAATYTWSLRRTSDAAKRTAAVVKQRALVTGTMPRSVAQGPLREDGSDQHMSGFEDEDQPPPALEEPAPVEDEESRGRWDLPWGKVVLASLAVMIAGLAGVTAVEAVTGKPISSFFGRDDGTGTTVGNVVRGGGTSSSDEDQGQDKDQTPKQDEQEPQKPQPSAEPSEEPEEPLPSTPVDPSVVPTPQESQAPDAGPAPDEEGTAPEDGTVQN